MLRIYLDLETIPPDRDEPSVGGKLANCSEDEYRHLALNGDYGRILCIGLIVERDDLVIHHGVLGRERSSGRFHLDESRTLRAFWRLLQDFNPRRDLLIGFNILDFDLHFVCTRSVIRQVKPSYNICFARFRSSPVYDVMWEFTHWRHRLKLDELAKILGLESSKQNGIDGSTVYDLFLAGRHQEIADYCIRDVELVRKIYRRLNFLSETEFEDGKAISSSK
jgi:3'-5' exonuclease